MGKTILLVDDDSLIRKSLGSTLLNNGYAIVEATNGKEGLAEALSSHPDLIVADVHMPVMDGFAMIEELRKDSWGKTVPVIVMSSDDSTPAVNQALQAGITVYLAKTSISPDSLVDQITATLDSV